MNEVLRNFWYNLLVRIDNKINQYLNSSGSGNNELSASDTDVINFFVMVLKCVLNRVMMDCDFKVVSKSTQAEPLKLCAKNLTENAYKIGGYMLGGSHSPENKSECWAILIDKKCGIHHYMSGNEICIVAKSGDHITDCFMIWNTVKRNDKLYFLCRRHTLDKDGNLTMRFFIANENAGEIEADIPEWDDFLYAFNENSEKKRKEIVIKGANHIGFGRYKSPVLSFGDDTYGKPLNFGCSKIEKDIQITLGYIQEELKATKTKLFPDWSIVKKTGKDGSPQGLYEMNGYIYPVRTPSGESRTKLVDYFSPEIRTSTYYGVLTQQLEQYQALMGVQELITHERTSHGATATEVYNSNINNISMEKSVRAAMAKGNLETLKADGLYYGIRDDIWSYDETWKDIYENEQQTLENWLALYNAGACTLEDLLDYWFSTLNEEQIREKAEEIRSAMKNNTVSSLEDMLNK